MSRSMWAGVESCRPVSVVAPRADGRVTLEDRGRLGDAPLAGAGSSAKCLLVGLMATSMLVMAAAPASALAGSTGGSHPKRPPNHSNPPSAHVAHAGAAVLALGSGYANQRDAVRVLQRRLSRAGYVPGPIDGRYGPRTEQAVIRFQVVHGLPLDGIAGPRTLAALRSASVVLYPGAGYAGHGSGAVRALQRRLSRAGYVPGPIDGRYGPRTEQAVTRFQIAHGLLVDGIAGPQTVARLATEGRPPRTDGRARSTSAHPRAHRPVGARRSHLRTHIARRRHAPAPREVVAPTRSTNSRSLALIVLLVVALVAVGLWATWLAYRRHASQYAVGDAAKLAEGPDSAAAVPRHAISTTTPNQTTLPRADLTGPDPADRAFSDGLLLEEQGELLAAVASYRRADQLGHGAAACNLGALLAEQGDWAAAGECFRRADQRGDPHGAFNLAVFLEEEGRQIEALSAYERAEQFRDPETAEKARAAAHDLRRRLESLTAAQQGGGGDDS